MDNSTGQVFTLGEVVVEGERDTISKVTTVDTIKKETIDLNTATNVADALKSVPGVTMAIGSRNEKMLTVRGFTARYIPVFYDGIPVSIPYDGYVDLGKLPTGPVSQITLSKGISSALYGSNTMGGVLNIISRKPEKKFEADFDTQWSEGSRWDTNVNIGSRLGKFYFMGTYGYTDQDAFVLSEHHHNDLNQSGHYRANSYIDNENTYNFKFGFLPADGQEYAVGFNRVKGGWGLPPEEGTIAPKYWRFTDWEKSTYYFIGDTKLADTLQLKTRLYRDEAYNELDSYDDDTYTIQDSPSSFHSTYDDHTVGGSATLSSTYFNNNTIGLSFHLKDDVHKEQDDYGYKWERFETKTYSYGLEDDIRLTDKLSLVVGASYDKQVPWYANGGQLRRNEEAFNPQAGVNYAAAENTILHASVGKKSRFPSLKELYSNLLGTNIANPNLKSERALNYEAGIEQRLPGNTTLKFNLFYNDISDYIVSREISFKVNQYINIGKTSFKGFEINLQSGCLRDNDFQIHYTWLHAEDRSPNRTSNHLEYQPKHNLYISDQYTINRYLSVFCALTLNSERYYQDSDDYMNWDKVSGFCTMDMKLIAKLTKYFTLEAGARNLFDEDYSYSHGFPQAGRTFFTIVRGKLW